MSDRCCYIKRDGTRCRDNGRTKVGRDDGVIDTFCHSHNPERMDANRAKHRERYYARKAAEIIAAAAAEEAAKADFVPDNGDIVVEDSDELSGDKK